MAGLPPAGAGHLPGREAFRRACLTLRGQLSDPLLRNGYALMANTGATGLLGVAYWLLAARHYAAADVGRAAAAYSAMNLLSGLTALNLVGALTRFVPQSGRRTAGLVLRAYTFSSLASVLVAVPFLVAVGHLGSSYAELSGITAGLVFTACVVCWGIFTLQDGVLVGLRSAVWVPVENGAFGVVKIVLLLALATSLPHAGIYISWILPVAISLPLVNALIFGKLMQPHARLTAARTPPSARQIGRFLVGDYTGALCVLAVYYLVPLAVAARTGPSVNAYFYVAWMVGGVLDLFAVNMAASLTVEGAFDEATLAANCRTALRTDDAHPGADRGRCRSRRAGDPRPVRATVRGTRCAHTRAPRRSHAAQGADRAVPRRVARAEPDVDDRASSRLSAAFSSWAWRSR